MRWAKRISQPPQDLQVAGLRLACDRDSANSRAISAKNATFIKPAVNVSSNARNSSSFLAPN
jgi:hypothetical protein